MHYHGYLRLAIYFVKRLYGRRNIIRFFNKIIILPVILETVVWYSHSPYMPIGNMIYELTGVSHIYSQLGLDWSPPLHRHGDEPGHGVP